MNLSSATSKILALVVISLVILVLAFILFRPRSQGGCGNTPAEARNPENGQIKNFSNLCQVPSGWEIISGGN